MPKPAREKPEGIRPIGAAVSLRRLVGRALLADKSAALAAGVGGHRLEAGLKGGGEKLAHLVRATAEGRPTDVWVALDLSNAFGMLRETALAEAAQAVGVPAYLEGQAVRVPPELTAVVVPAAGRALAPNGGRIDANKHDAGSPGPVEPPGLPPASGNRTASPSWGRRAARGRGEGRTLHWRSGKRRSRGTCRKPWLPTGPSWPAWNRPPPGRLHSFIGKLFLAKNAILQPLDLNTFVNPKKSAYWYLALIVLLLSHLGGSRW